MDLIILSGLSGSGKSSSLNILEDMGYHCIDNMPIECLDYLIKSLSGYTKIAIGIDIRTIIYNENTANIKHLFKIIDTLKVKNNINLKLIYITAQDQIISRRFNSTKRKHPLVDLSFEINSINDALYKEREILDPLASIADLVIDTSEMSPYGLQDYLLKYLKYQNDNRLFIQSFGFKHGLPANSDYIFDVRFIPNPYWDEKIRGLTGKDQKIKDFLFSHDISKITLNKYYEFIIFLYNQNKTINKSYINISIGCTGGQHRSVFIVEELAKLLEENSIKLNKFHRDLT